MSGQEEAATPPAAASELPAADCVVCGDPLLAGERYCETCGNDRLAAVFAPVPVAGHMSDQVTADNAAADQVPVAAGQLPAGVEIPGACPAAQVCATCGGRIAEDGYCETCGAPAVRERDHWTENPAPWVAAVCDRGIKHWRNEDAVAISAVERQGELAALVVCDGVSSSADSDLASLAAARAARDVLIRPASTSPSIAGRIRGWTEQFAVAAQAASDAVHAVTATQAGANARPASLSNAPGGGAVSPPSCTFVGAVVDGPVIVAGWIGDSRAYWLPDNSPAEQLSVDDSWATEQINAGVPRQQAEASPQAHAITRWLGVDAPGNDPRCATTIPNGPGWLLVCSDGLWNYCSPAQDLARLVRTTAADVQNDPLRTAGGLVAWANQQGGHDNITVALARLHPADETGAEITARAEQDALEAAQPGTAPTRLTPARATSAPVEPSSSSESGPSDQPGQPDQPVQER